MKETELLQSLEYLDDAYLLEAERAMNRKVHKSWHLGRRAAMLVAAVFLLVLTASAAYLATHWDQVFLDRFAPSEAVLNQSENAVQEISAVSQCGGVTLRVHQTIGDETMLYLNLDITLPDSVDLTPYLGTDPETGEVYNTGVMPDNLLICTRPAHYEDLRTMDFEEAVAWFGPDGDTVSAVSTETTGFDPETNTLSYLVSVTANDGGRFRGDVTLLVDSLVYYGDEDIDVIAEGPFVISWKASNESEVYRFDLLQGDGKAGEVVLSAFGLRVSLDESDFTDCMELAKQVELVYADGTTTPPEGTCTGSLSLPSGSVSVEWQFDEIQLFDRIVEIHVGDYVCKLHTD